MENIHVEQLQAPNNFLIRVFKDGDCFGDDYTASLVVSIFPELFIEVHGLNGQITRQDYREFLRYLRGIAGEYHCPVVAERGQHNVARKDFILNNSYWFLKENNNEFIRKIMW